MHLRRVYQNLGKFLVAAEVLQIIAPEAGLSFEAQAVGHTVMQFRFFAVNIGGQPEARPHIQTPTVKVKIKTVARGGAIRAVETDDIVILIFNPNPPHETAATSVLLRLDVDHKATHLSQKFSSNESKIVVFALEVIVYDYHLGKAKRQESHGIQAGQFGKDPATESRLAHKRAIFGSIAQVDPAQKILIIDRHCAQFAIAFEVLDIGLNQGMELAHLCGKEMLPLNHFVEDLIK